MSQNDMVIANQTAASARTDINSALQALASNSLGSSAPSTTYAGQFWFDSANDILKIRNEGNSGWLDVGLFSSGAFVPSPGMASQAEAVAGTENTKFMTALRVAQAAFPTVSAAQNGYIKLGGSILLQWGYKADTGTSMQIDYPTSFSSVVYCIQFSMVDNSSNFQNITVDTDYATSLSHFDINWNSDAAGILWFAIGV
jgi:hypothetical protein